MLTLIKKLKLDKQLDEIYVLNKPDDYQNSFNDLNYCESLVSTSCVNCALLFVNSKEAFVHQMMTLFPRLQDTSTLWVAYPKFTAKAELANLHKEFDWDFLGDYRLKPVKQVSLNKDWNAIKLKKVIYFY